MKKVGKINPMRFGTHIKNFFSILFLIVVASCIPSAQPENTPAAVTTSLSTPILEAKPEETITPSPGPMHVIPDQVLPGTEISFWHAWSGARANLIEGIAWKFNDENEWGIQVSIESHADASVLLDDIIQAFETGNGPDLVAAEPFALNLFSSQGFPVQDLSPYIASEQWGFSELEFNGIPLVFLKPDQASGIQAGISASRTGYVIFYNQSWARELGFSQIPSTIDDLRDQACAAARANLNDRDAGNDGTGGFLYQDSPEALLSWMHSFGGGLFGNSNNRIFFESKENSLALEYLYDLYHSDCAWVSFEPLSYRYFAERYALFYSGRLQDIIIQASYNQTSGSQDEWTVIPYPSGGLKPTMLVDGYSYGMIGEDPQKMLAAWIFIKYLLEAENQIEQIEQSAEFPIYISIVDQMDSFKIEYPAWQQAVDLLPIAGNVPAVSDWGVARSLIKDFANKDILFFADKEAIPEFLRSADSIMQEMDRLP